MNARRFLCWLAIMTLGAAVLTSCATRTPERPTYSIPILFHYYRDAHGYKFWLIPFKRIETNEISEIGIRPFWTFRDKKRNNERLRVILPFMWNRSSMGESLDLFPILSMGWEKTPETEKESFILTPVMFREWEKNSCKESTFSGIMPCYFKYHEKTDKQESKTMIVPPLWLKTFETDKEKETTETATMIPWLLLERHKTKGQNVQDTLDLLWPVYQRKTTIDSGGEALDTMRFLIFSYEKNTKGTRVFRILGIPFI